MKTIRIDGMMCDHCKKRVETALKEKAKEVEVSLENKCAILKDSTLSNEEITNIINDLGFEVLGIDNEWSWKS